MPRLIDADALLKGKDDHQIISTHLIWNAPTVDAVEVVRCGECKHFKKMYSDRGICTYKWACHGVEGMIKENWYCADGERKDDA